jgi:ubiquinone/menaquinone biosynthesis C-methylase UbiE
MKLSYKYCSNIIMKFLKKLKRFYKIYSKKYNKSSIWLKLFIIGSLILVFLQKYNLNNPKQEGFSQMEKYIVKENDELYDDFYVDYYDDISKDLTKLNFEIDEICQATKTDKKNSKILDVGCGTGNLVNKFVKKGYTIKGVDKSEAMVKKASEKHPNCNFSKADALNSLSHPPNSFTHILCTYFTIYYIKDKMEFFKNAYDWLKQNGTLTLHLVNRDKFNPIVNAADVLIAVSPQKYAKERITNSLVKFKNFQYKADFKLQKHKNIAVFDETFKDDTSGNIRQNKHTLFMDTQKNILSLAKSVGFILQGKIDMVGCNYEYQYLYVLKKA